MTYLNSADANERNYFFLNQGSEYILCFEINGFRYIYPTLFDSLESVLKYFFFAIQLDVPSSQITLIVSLMENRLHLVDAMEKAKAVFETKERLRKGATTFAYENAKGETRNAIGTLNFAQIPFTKQPKGTGKVNSPLIVKYFDLERNAFRSFRADRFIA